MTGMPIGFWSSLISTEGTWERTRAGFFRPSSCHVKGANTLFSSTQSCFLEAWYTLKQMPKVTRMMARMTTT